MTSPSNYPIPIVYGPDFPKFKMLMRGGRQVFESRTNQNLFLKDDEYFGDFDGSGTFTMAALLKRAPWRDVPQLFFVEIEESESTFDWLFFADEPNWESCSMCSDLLGYCDTEPQRLFLRAWWRTQYAIRLGEAYRRWVDWLARSAEARQRRLADPVAALGGPAAFVEAVAARVLDFPALIPEVWLNYVGPERTLADEEHLRENPQRVDFVMLAEGRKCVVEIDGPSHYATFDEGPPGRYEVSEERYAKNLKVERSLRRQGWEIHRFANVEIRGASDDDFVALVEHLPGYQASSFFGRPLVTGEGLRDAWGGSEPFLVG
jgi:hypothetical protein